MLAASQNPVDLRDPVVLHEWASALHVQEAALLAAAELVGCMPTALKFYFASKSRKGRPVVTAADRMRFEAIKLGRRKKRSFKALSEP